MGGTAHTAQRDDLSTISPPSSHHLPTRCVTGGVAGTTNVAAAVVLNVRGVAATCTPSSDCSHNCDCGYLYASALTPILSTAVATSKTDALWTLSLTGTGFATPATDNSVTVGTAPCTPTGGS